MIGRYFGSKNDVLFGNFEFLLEDFEEWLTSESDDRPMFDVIADATMRFNRVHSDGPAAHRERMELILHTPALRANAALRNAEWLAVVAGSPTCGRLHGFRPHRRYALQSHCRLVARPAKSAHSIAAFATLEIGSRGHADDQLCWFHRFRRGP